MTNTTTPLTREQKLEHALAEMFTDIRTKTDGISTATMQQGLAALSSPATQQAEPLFEFIAHGDERHRAWLRKACVAFFAGDERPEPEPAAPLVGEKAEPALREALREVWAHSDAYNEKHGITRTPEMQRMYLRAQNLLAAPPAAEQAAPFDHAHPDSWKYEAKSEPLTREQAAALVASAQAAPPQTPEPVADTEVVEKPTCWSVHRGGVCIANFAGPVAERHARLFAATPEQAAPLPQDALALAIRFHETYERLAPSFGYETRPDTKQFDPESKNGRLMVAVCAELGAPLPQGADKP